MEIAYFFVVGLLVWSFLIGALGSTRWLSVVVPALLLPVASAVEIVNGAGGNWLNSISSLVRSSIAPSFLMAMVCLALDGAGRGTRSIWRRMERKSHE
jgi:hypothetical protein